MPLRLTPAVKALLIACFAAFVVQQTADGFMGGNLQAWLALVPSGFVLQHRFWQIVTYAFLHGDVTHLVLNLMMLVFIGSELEAFWGTTRFLRYYFFCAVSAGFLYLMLQLFGIGGEAGLHTPMVGASGAIYGLLMAYGIIYGERVLLFMMLFPMKAKHFVWILMGIEFMSTVFSHRGSGLANAAHLGGMVAGFGYLWGRAAWQVMKKRRGQPGGARGRGSRSKGGRKREHLKLIIDNEREFAKDSDDDLDGPKTWH